MVELLRESGHLIGDPRPITHHVKFFEKGDRPLEIVTSRQWFIKTMDFRAALLARGEALALVSAHMRARYENWVNGLNGDWCVSRQRFFGVPFPGVVPRRRRRHARLRRAAGAGRVRAARSIRPPTCRPGSGRPARRARRLHRRSGRHGHLGHLVALAVHRVRLGVGRGALGADLPDAVAPAGARHHPHVAVFDRAARAPRDRVAALGERRRFPGGCSIPTGRRCRSRRATSSRRWRCSRSTVRTPSGTGPPRAGRAWTPRSMRARCRWAGAWRSSC